MHDLLTDTLPTEWEGRAINWDFRPMIWLLIRTRRAKTDEDNARLICEAVQRFFVGPVPGVQYPEAFESLVRFCQGGGPRTRSALGLAAAATRRTSLCWTTGAMPTTSWEPFSRPTAST